LPGIETRQIQSHLSSFQQPQLANAKIIRFAENPVWFNFLPE